MKKSDKRTYGSINFSYGNYSGYMVNGKPDGKGTFTCDRYDNYIYGQRCDGKEHGIILNSQSTRGASYSHFRLELYRNGEKVSYISFSNLNSDDTPGGSYYWDKIKSEIDGLLDDDYESSQNYYYRASSYLSEQQEIINNTVERERSRREAEREREREREREAEEYRNRQEKKLDWARMYGNEDDVRHYEDKIKDLDGDNGCIIS